MRNVLVDCDDVLLDWTEGFKQYLKFKHNIHVHGRPQNWDLSKWIKIDKQDAIRLVTDFNENSEEFGDLKPTKQSHSFLTNLHSEGYTFTVITSCSDNINCIDRRQRNLENVFGSLFDDIICLPLGVSKGVYLEKFEPSFWVEDNYHNCLIGHELGHHGIVVRQEHNRDFETVTDTRLHWKDDWSEISDHIRHHSNTYTENHLGL